MRSQPPATPRDDLGQQRGVQKLPFSGECRWNNSDPAKEVICVDVSARVTKIEKAPGVVIPVRGYVKRGYVPAAGGTLRTRIRKLVDGVETVVFARQIKLSLESRTGDLYFDFPVHAAELEIPFDEPQAGYNLRIGWADGVGNYYVNQQPLTLYPLRAFPSADGFGAFSRGGRPEKDPVTGAYQAETRVVTNLNDDGVGSLRWAITSSDPAKALTVLFKTSGLITLSSGIRITRSNVTIAGQSSPRGITIAARTAVPGNLSYDRANLTPIEIDSGVSNIMLRHLKVPPGGAILPWPEPNADGDQCPGSGAFKSISIGAARNAILDHLSLSWANDEIVSTWPDGDNQPTNITFMNSIIAEGLQYNAATNQGGSMSLRDPDRWRYPCAFSADGHASIFTGKNMSFLRNLLAEVGHRTPVFSGPGPFEVVNNLVYHSGVSYYHLDEGRCTRLAANFINNHYRAPNVLPANIPQSLWNIQPSYALALSQRTSACLTDATLPRLALHYAGNVVEGSVPPLRGVPLRRRTFSSSTRRCSTTTRSNSSPLQRPRGSTRSTPRCRSTRRLPSSPAQTSPIAI
jgi:hypothetical protein